jgi:hypothetical protein
MADWRPMKLGRYWFVLVPLLAVGELGAHLYFARRPPDLQEWRDVAPAVSSLRRDEDLVIVAPAWAEPVARMAVGDGLMPLRDVARPDESRYAAALEISLLGQRSGLTRNWSLLEERAAGKFTLRRLKNPEHQPIAYDFVEHVNGADASARVHNQADQPCEWRESAPLYAGGLGGAPTFPAQRFVCPTAPMHVFVGVTVIEDQHYMPRRCIMMHAPSGGYLETTFRDVPLRSELRGHSGMRWIVERELTGAPILLEVWIDGERVGQDVHVDGEGWKPWRMPLGAHAGQTKSVSFRVSSSKESQRQMCWEADTR